MIQIKSIKKALNNEEGFTLVEIMAAIIIISIVVTSFLVFFVQSERTAVNTENATRATYHAQEILEEFYSYSDTISYNETESILIEEASSYSEIENGRQFVFVQNGFRSNVSVTTVQSEGAVSSDLYTLLVEVYSTDNDSNRKLTQLETRLLFSENEDD